MVPSFPATGNVNSASLHALMNTGATFPIRRIALLSVHTGPLAPLGGKKTGGMNVYVREIARAFARIGIQVDVFTRLQDDREAIVCADLGPGVRVVHIAAGPPQPIPVDDVAKYLDEFTAGTLDFVRRQDVHYDVVHSHYWLSGLVAERLRMEWSGTPVVQMFHTLGHMKNEIARDGGERASQARLDGEAQVVRAADRIVAATPTEKQQLITWYDADPAKIAIIPPGVDLDRFHPIDQNEAKARLGIPLHHTNILFAGRIERLKGVDTLLRAACLLRHDHPEVMDNVCLAIVGGDPWAENLDAEMARLQALRSELGVHDLVTFLGAKDQKTLPYYYAAAAFVVMPSYYESFGLVALEAMAMGTPVIASEVGGLVHLVKHGYNGLHVPAGDPAALARRMYELITNVDYRKKLGHQARHYAAHFDWNRIAGRILALYCELVA